MMQQQPAEPGTLAFMVLKKDTQQPLGTFDQEGLLSLLNAGHVNADDLVYFEGLPSWQPISSVFDIQEQITHFIDDGQDLEKVGEAYREIENVIGPDTNIYYIAIQARASLLSKTTLCTVICDQGIYILSRKRFGNEIEAHDWSSIERTSLKEEGKGMAVFSIFFTNGSRIDVPHLPLKQAQRLFQLAQEIKGQ